MSWWSRGIAPRLRSQAASTYPSLPRYGAHVVVIASLFHKVPKLLISIRKRIGERTRTADDIPYHIAENSVGLLRVWVGPILRDKRRFIDDGLLSALRRIERRARCRGHTKASCEGGRCGRRREEVGDRKRPLCVVALKRHRKTVGPAIGYLSHATGQLWYRREREVEIWIHGSDERVLAGKPEVQPDLALRKGAACTTQRIVP